jgi:TolB-like protein
MKYGVSARFSLPLFFSFFLLAVGCASGSSQSGMPGAGDMRPSEEGGRVGDASALPASQQQESGNLPGVAVWPFSNGGSFGSDPWDYEALGIGLQQMLITELSLNSGLRLVERSRIREIIDELELGQSGYVDPETTANVGKLVQARYMIVGSFIDANGTIRLDARIDDVETGEILVETAAKVQGDREKLLDMVVDLGVKIVDAAHLPPLPAQVVEEREALDYPAEAIQLYSRALRREERGDREGMAELLRQLTTDFPQHIEGRQMLEQYGIRRPGESDSQVRRIP